MGSPVWSQVLISTYWNVNTTNDTFSNAYAVVLISTYWNVNTRIAIATGLENSFNLNLLECKSILRQRQR